jgi:hypothetical protein
MKCGKKKMNNSGFEELGKVMKRDLTSKARNKENECNW